MLWMGLTVLGSLAVLIILLNVRTDQVEEEYPDIYSLLHYPLVDYRYHTVAWQLTAMPSSMPMGQWGSCVALWP